MITDILSNINKYKGLGKNMDLAIDYITKNNLNDVDFGKTIINDDLFFIKSKYETKSDIDMLFEAHEKYIDLQVILYGNELITGCDINELKIVNEYDKEKEAKFLKGNESWSIKCKKDIFAIFDFHDAHKPGLILDEKSDVIKVVFKING